MGCILYVGGYIYYIFIIDTYHIVCVIGLNCCKFVFFRRIWGLVLGLYMWICCILCVCVYTFYILCGCVYILYTLYVWESIHITYCICGLAASYVCVSMDIVYGAGVHTYYTLFMCVSLYILHTAYVDWLHPMCVCL